LGLDLLADERQDPRTRQTLAFFSSLLGLDRLSGELAVYQETRSILGTVQELARTGNPLVAVLIALFSVVIPLAKLGLQLLTLLLRAPAAQATLDRVIRAIGKWSMADVFVMALIVTYLAGSASGHLGELMRLDARLEPGFWFFLGYCLFSIASSLLVVRPLPGAQPQA
ncbi:MAG TPA: paraquat-inducible protein A, partial [Gammaproteobacteria bacterium]